MPASDSVPSPANASAPPEIGGIPGTPTSPVAVVWCRQVDNEAESPGYTTVPEEFPGLKETLEVIRVVGHLTINVADTHDYWDPDPSQPLSYYPNLFLYPAFGGRYTCIGRMFLSTEDRPRLGMKTLVLDTQKLLASGEFGATILRWHASMGGARADSTRAPPVPDPKLYDLVGEGFLFHKGSTDPVLLVASDQWEPAMQVVLDLIRSLPASLVALGAFLAFPYFLPEAKTNLHEFTEQLPLALALMRIGRGEAAGDRHEKRMSSWESGPITLRDLTDGLPGASRGKETTPLILQHIRDRNRPKLGTIVQRVDLVESPRLKAHLADPERQGGRDRRKEMWRIGTAMESAALLLQRARGRHVPVNVETAKRAQAYIQAELPEPAEGPSGEPAPVAVYAGPDLPIPSQHPPWLQRAPDPPVSAPSKDPEVVPVSVSEDPSLLSSAARPAPPPLIPPSPGPATAPSSTARPATPASPAPPSRGATPPAPPRAAPGSAPAPGTSAPSAPPAGPSAADLTQLKQSLAAEFLRLLDDRLAAQAAKAPRPVPGLDATASQQVDERLKAHRDQVVAELARQSTALQERLGRDEAALEARQRDLLATLVVQSIDRRWTERVEPKLAELVRSVEAAIKAQGESARAHLESEVGRVSQELATSITGVEEAVQASVSARLDLLVNEAADRDREARSALAQELTRQLDTKLEEAEQRRSKELRELEQKVSLLLDGRLRDLQEKSISRAQADLDKLRKEIDRGLAVSDGRHESSLEQLRSDLHDTQVHAMADLQVRLQAYTDQKLKEDVERERQKNLELLARLKAEVDGSTARLLESPRFDATIRERLQRSLEAYRPEMTRLVDERVAPLASAGRAQSAEALERAQRVEAALEARRAELLTLEETVRSELDDLDRRAQILADRLVPVVRKTWQRISELEKTAGPGGEELGEMKADLEREVHRVETEMAGRLTELRDRMETAISNQGRVWLTMVRQLSQLTEDRRVIEESRALLEERGGAEGADEATNLEALPSLLQSRTRAAPEREEDEPSPREAARRRRRPFSRS